MVDQYPQRNHFEMAAHDAQFEKPTSLLDELKAALADYQEPVFRKDGKLNI